MPTAATALAKETSGARPRLWCIELGVVMPIHGPISQAGPALHALSLLSPAPTCLVVVRDVPAQPDDELWLPRGAMVVQVPFASGPARARNAGAAQVGAAEWLVFIDADVVVPPDTLGRIREAVGRYPEVAAVFGSYDDAPADPGFLSQYRNLMHHYVHQQANEVAGTFWAGLGAVRTEAFRAVGGFDATYGPPSIEDIELGCRLRDAGREIRLVKSLQGQHLKRWTVRGMLTTDLWQRGVPWMRLILARGKAPADLNTGWAARWSTGLAWAGLLALPWAAVWMPAGLLAAAAWLLVFALNRPFYRFLRERRGLGFALGCLPWHLVFFLQCGLAGLLGLLLHGTDKCLSRVVNRSGTRAVVLP